MMEKRANALNTLRRIQANYDGRNDDLTEEQVEELANRFAHEFIDDLVAEGKISFERDGRRCASLSRQSLSDRSR